MCTTEFRLVSACVAVREEEPAGSTHLGVYRNRLQCLFGGRYVVYPPSSGTLVVLQELAQLYGAISIDEEVVEGARTRH